MIEEAWEKKELLYIMMNDYLNTNGMKYSIGVKECDPLKICLDELLLFHDVTNIVLQSHVIAPSIVLRMYQLLLHPLQSEINELYNSMDIKNVINKTP